MFSTESHVQQVRLGELSSALVGAAVLLWGRYDMYVFASCPALLVGAYFLLEACLCEDLVSCRAACVCRE